MILHIVNKSPFDNNSLRDCLQHYGEQDSILLIEDAVFAALESAPIGTEFVGKTVYALSADIEARGLQSRLNKQVKLVNDAGFVGLAVQHPTSTSWY